MRIEPSSQEERNTVPRKRRAPRRRKAAGRDDLKLKILSSLRSLWHLFLQGVRPFKVRIAAHRMQTLETLSLGNRRTISVVRVDGQELVIGATPNSVVLLTRLDRTRSKMAILPKAEDLVAKFNAKVQ